MWIARLECVLCCILFAAPVVEPSVWFGPKNEFLCHCEKNHCNIDGECVHGSKCSRGWFGRTCQYFDILGSFNNQHTLTDGDDKTCLGPNSGNVNLTLGATYPFSSIRLVYQDGMTLSKAPDLVLGCATKTYALNNHIWDYFCEDYVTVNHVELKGKTPHNLCSVYFSGGRNIALKQHAFQSSLYRKCFAHNAVNGEKDNCQLDYTHTSTIDSDPYFEVHFKYPSTIHLVKIYNRKSEPNNPSDIGLRLKDFVLKLFDSQQTLTHQHQQSAVVQAIYNIEVRNLQHIERIRVDSLKIQFDFDRVPMLSICEIEVYGDCDHGFWDLDCKKCESCSGSCHKETGQCENECSAGYWGLDCQNKCDEDCANPCHRETGRCEKESIGTHTWFGSRKQYQCNCEDDYCHEDGHCRPGVKCYNGWFGKYCQYVDLLVDHDSSNTVTDGEDFTCLDNGASSLTLELGGVFTVSYIRLVYIYGKKQDVQIEYQTMTSPFTCPNAKTYTEDNIQDIYCDHNQLVKALVLKGPGVSSLCSVYFSGGRNLALKQKVVLTPDSTNADNTVDGNWWNCEHLQTSITKETPFIEISFHKTVSISRFRLHNRVYGEDVKSTGVVIDAFDEQSTRLLHYTNESTMQLEFNLNIEKLHRVSKVKITNPNTKSSSFSDFVDNICEIQIFGDCIDGSWGLDCENKCDKKCGNVCHKETGKC